MLSKLRNLFLAVYIDKGIRLNIYITWCGSIRKGCTPSDICDTEYSTEPLSSLTLLDLMKSQQIRTHDYSGTWPLERYHCTLQLFPWPPIHILQTKRGIEKNRKNRKNQHLFPPLLSFALPSSVLLSCCLLSSALPSSTPLSTFLSSAVLSSPQLLPGPALPRRCQLRPLHATAVAPSRPFRAYTAPPSLIPVPPPRPPPPPWKRQRWTCCKTSTGEP